MPRSASTDSVPGHVRALGKPDAPGGAEAALVRAKPGVELEPAAREGRELREHRVRRGRCHQLDASLGSGSLERAERHPVERLERGDRAGVVLGLAFGRRLEFSAGSRRVALGRPEAVALQELEHPLPHPAGLELVGEDGRDRHRQPLGDVGDRQMRAGDGVEQPLLAEGIGPEPLHVGHVRMKDDRQVA